MLNDNLYQLLDFSNTDGNISAIIVLDPEHEIFRGHYPGQPVLPGACMLQIVKEVLETALSSTLLIIQASQLKFLVMVDPKANARLKIEISYKIIDEKILVKATLTSDNVAVFKFSGSFKPF